MAVNKEIYQAILNTLGTGITLVAVSKTKPVEAIQELYALGQRDFGENYVQELADKQSALPPDIRWHFIGHLQSNKVKQLASFVHLIHGVDSLKLLGEINKQGVKHHRVIHVLLQVHIAKEETKFGLDEQELENLLQPQHLAPLDHICVQGLMGMASFTEDKTRIKKEFGYLQALFNRYAVLPLPHCSWEILSMGMSSDYAIALQEGSNMVRIGSLLFGSRK